MQQIELQQRLRGVENGVEALPAIGGGKRGEQIRRALLAAARQSCNGYRDVCVSSSPDEFIERISFVARKAKRTVALLVLLVQLDYIRIEQVRELIIEARALERILTAAKNTSRRRQRQRRARRSSVKTDARWR